MGLSMRRDKWANPIRFDNLDPLRGVFGRTQCCKITTGLSLVGTTGQTSTNCNTFAILHGFLGRICSFPAYLADRALRHEFRTRALVATCRSGPAANELTRSLEIRKVVDLGPRQVPHGDRLGLELAPRDQLRIDVLVIEIGLTARDLGVQRVE